jgi:hypothetical protein
VKDSEEAEIGSEVLRIGADLEKRFGAGPEQEVIEDFRVVLTERVQLMGNGEYHVEVGHAEHFLFAGGEPALARLRLALWGSADYDTL